MPSQSVASVSGVFPTDAKFRRLEIGLSSNAAFAISHGSRDASALAPELTVAYLTCDCSFHLSDPGKSLDPRTFLRVHPGCAGDTTERLAAQRPPWWVATPTTTTSTPSPPGLATLRVDPAFVSVVRIERDVGVPLISLIALAGQRSTLRRLRWPPSQAVAEHGVGIGCRSDGRIFTSSGDWDSGNPAFAISRGSRDTSPRTPGDDRRFAGMRLFRSPLGSG